MKTLIESYKEKINLIYNLTYQFQLSSENMLENIPSASNG